MVGREWLVKIVPFLIVFFSAFLLTHILLGVFDITPFNLVYPSLFSLVATGVAWLFGWGVSYIVYVTLRDAIREKKENKDVLA